MALSITKRPALLRRHKDLPTAALLLLPALVVLIPFGIAPFFYAIYISLFDIFDGAGPYIGLGNYGQAVADKALLDSLLNSLYYALGVVPTSIVMAFFIAYMLSRIVRIRGILRTLYFLPYVTSAVAASMIWKRALLNPDFGVVNVLLEKLGFQPQLWLLESKGILHILTDGAVPEFVGPSLALCCIIAFDIWHTSGFMIIIFLAALSTVPKELEEAARLDGAGTFQLMRHITAPILSPTILFLVIVGTIGSLQAFNSFYALAERNGRGPGDSTQNVVVYIYTNFYVNGYWGYGAAVAVLLSVGIIVLTLGQWNLLSRRVHYQ